MIGLHHTATESVNLDAYATLATGNLPPIMDYGLSDYDEDALIRDELLEEGRKFYNDGDEMPAEWATSD